MIIKKPYELLNRDNKAYTIPNNWIVKGAMSTKVKTLEASIKNSFGEDKGQDKKNVASIWASAYVPFDKSMLQNYLTSNVLVPLKDVHIYEYFGQRDALEECRHHALIGLSKGFDWKQFEPIKIANIDGKLYCYDGGGRGHIVHATGLEFIPCSIVKLENLSELRVLFMEQKKLTKPISLNTKYVQALAIVQDSIAKNSVSWWQDLDKDQKQWYNVFKLLQSSKLQADGQDFTALGGLRKAYSSFVLANGYDSPTSRSQGDSDPSIESPSLVSALNTYRSFLVNNSLHEKMQCSIASYLGQITRKLYDPKNGVSINFAEKIIKDTLILAHNKYLKQEEFKTFATFFSHKMENFTGVMAWRKKDATLGDKVTSDYSWFGRLVYKSISAYPCKVQQQAFIDALARKKHI